MKFQRIVLVALLGLRTFGSIVFLSQYPIVWLFLLGFASALIGTVLKKQYGGWLAIIVASSHIVFVLVLEFEALTDSLTSFLDILFSFAMDTMIVITGYNETTSISRSELN
jgi:hypothetical protein